MGIQVTALETVRSIDSCSHLSHEAPSPIAAIYKQNTDSDLVKTVWKTVELEILKTTLMLDYAPNLPLVKRMIGSEDTSRLYHNPLP